MRMQWILGLAALSASAVCHPAAAEEEHIVGRVQAVNADQIVLITENGTTFIKLTAGATVAVVKPGQAGAQPKEGAGAPDAKPGKLSDVELGSTASVSVTRATDGLPVGSQIVVEGGA